MKTLIKSELERIISRKKTIILFCLFLLILIINSVWLQSFDVGYYTKTDATSVNNLNFPVLLGKESFIILSMIIIPILYLDSLSAEVQSGQYRFILIRGQSRIKKLLSKWISLVSVSFIFLLTMFLVGVVFGSVFAEKENSITFLNQPASFTPLDSFFYSIKFYGILFIVLSLILLLITLLSFFVPSTIFHYIVTMGLLILVGYNFSDFRYFLFAGEEAFKVLADGFWLFFTTNILVILVMILLNLFIWQKKDFY